MAFSKAAVALLALVGSARAQDTLYDAPVPLWTSTFLPMADNNGLVWAPDDSLVYATSSDGTVGAINPEDGSLYNSFQPTGDGTVPFRCTGEVDFSSDGGTLIYAVSEGDFCKVYALSHQQLDVVWSSPPLEGACEGTPKYVDDDTYVFVMHNSGGGTSGHFSVLDVAAGGTSFYKFDNPDNPFGPFGFANNIFPGGNYGAGTGNTNDMAIWGLKPSPGATGGQPGAVWAFQMPPPTSVGGPMAVNTIPATGWRHTAPPLLASQGQYLYWMISRSQIRAWYGSPFTVGADGEFGFDRGTPTFKSAPYTPAVDNNDSPTIMCGGPANPEFACFSATNINEAGGGPLWTVPTGGNGVFGDPLMSTLADRVYWTDNAGTVSAASPADGTGGWTAPTGVSLEANPELSSDGALFFFADTGGNVGCWEVGARTLSPVPLPPLGPPTAPTPAPPTDVVPVPPSPAPSMAPSNPGDTFAPSMSPAPTGEPTVAPAPTEATPTESGGTPTEAPPTEAGDTSGASSMAVLTVVAASVIAVVLF